MFRTDANIMCLFYFISTIEPSVALALIEQCQKQFVRAAFLEVLFTILVHVIFLHLLAEDVVSRLLHQAIAYLHS